MCLILMYFECLYTMAVLGNISVAMMPSWHSSSSQEEHKQNVFLHQTCRWESIFHRNAGSDNIYGKTSGALKDRKIH